MKHLMALALLFFAFATLAQPLPKEDPEDARRPPMQRYQGHLAFSLLMCRLSYIKAEQTAQLGEGGGKGDYRSCVSSATTKARELYDKVSATLRKPGAKQALKDVHIAYTVALKGTAPTGGETRITYEARQAAFGDQMNAALARLDLEL